MPPVGPPVPVVVGRVLRPPGQQDMEVFLDPRFEKEEEVFLEDGDSDRRMFLNGTIVER